MAIQINKIDDHISVATQLECEEIIALKEKGFKTILNNRPDNEVPNQPTSLSLEEEAKRLGLAYISLPVIGTDITDEQVNAFDTIVENADGPILAFCRTGTRCAALWALSEADKATVDSILERTKKTGYNLSWMKERLKHRRALLTRVM